MVQRVPTREASTFKCKSRDKKLITKYSYCLFPDRKHKTLKRTSGSKALNVIVIISAFIYESQTSCHESFNHIRNEYKTVIGYGQAIFIACFCTKPVILSFWSKYGSLGYYSQCRSCNYKVRTFNLIQMLWYCDLSLLLCAKIQSFRYSSKDLIPSLIMSRY